MTDREVLDKVYDPKSVEPQVLDRWNQAAAFRSQPSQTPLKQSFAMVIPPPNVTGALHLGHALNNTLQDILARYHRMRGFNTLWQPGTDHAGIATQAVVERRIHQQEGKNRHDLGREQLVKRIWQWKEEYEARIVSQLKQMGCSCDWERTRFTLDEGLAKAVRHMFFKLRQDGLIFRDHRLVNWDTQLQTAVSDDEVYHETVKGHFWHFKYPVIDPQPGEPHHVIIATTRPETMLGDTAVAVHPDPQGFMDQEETKLREMVATASSKERTEINDRLETLSERRATHLTALIKLRDMANDGRKLMLPLVERKIPLITDDWADPTKGSGCVKITPAHDPNDYEVGLRHNLPMISVLTEDGCVAKIVESDGSINKISADYQGLSFSGAGREKVIANMDQRELLAKIEDHEHELGHSDRSKVPIESYLSVQWFVKTKNHYKRGIQLSEESTSPGLAQAAIDAVEDGHIKIFPPRYAKSYLDWLREKRDWCISRQLWWGHRFPVWSYKLSDEGADAILNGRTPIDKDEHLAYKTWVELAGDATLANIVVVGGFEPSVAQLREPIPPSSLAVKNVINVNDSGLLLEKRLDVCLLIDDTNVLERLSSAGYSQDEDVLDTWFSSALWPFSTLGWPDQTEHLSHYYPGSVLCTSRDIITNWVARMVMFGLYATGKIPFDRVYIHPKILDGRGETMSKSKGNGVDPVDIIHTHGADALRYTMADMTTETQDIRMPVEYACPHCGKLTDQALAIKAETQARKSRGEKLDRKLQPADCTRVHCSHEACGKEFATQWADQETKKALGTARDTSDKFDIGRNFCNKLWNAARFAFMNLEGTPCDQLDIVSLPPEDRWILARLSQTIRQYHECLNTYQFSASIKILREFFWESLCDWYIELTKPRINAAILPSAGDDGSPQPEAQTSVNAESTSKLPSAPSSAAARQVLAFCMDQILRLWHPTIPFITEGLWQQFNAIVPKRGLPGIADLVTNVDLVLAPFPPVEGYTELEDPETLKVFSDVQDVVRAVRELRTQCGVSPKQKVRADVVLPKVDAEAFIAVSHIVRNMANLEQLDIFENKKRPANAGSVTVGSLRVFVHDISNDQAERTRAIKELQNIEKQIAGKQNKLSNEKFVAHADPSVVEAEQARLQDLTTQQTALKAHLAELEHSP